jgi:hypothetical protein
MAHIFIWTVTNAHISCGPNCLVTKGCEWKPFFLLVDEETFSSRAEHSPKTLSPLSRTGSQETGFRRPTVPARSARRKMGWERWSRQRNAQEQGGSIGCVLCICREERPLFYSHRGRWTGNVGGETNSQKTNQTISYSFSTQANRFSFHMTVQFCSPIMHDKKKGSATRHIPQTAARARHDEARWGVARRAAEEERAWESLLLTHSYHKGKSSPYMLVQLLLN